MLEYHKDITLLPKSIFHGNDIWYIQNERIIKYGLYFKKPYLNTLVIKEKSQEYHQNLVKLSSPTTFVYSDGSVIDGNITIKCNDIKWIKDKLIIDKSGLLQYCDKYQFQLGIDPKFNEYKFDIYAVNTLIFAFIYQETTLIVVVNNKELFRVESNDVINSVSINAHDVIFTTFGKLCYIPIDNTMIYDKVITEWNEIDIGIPMDFIAVSSCDKIALLGDGILGLYKKKKNYYKPCKNYSHNYYTEFINVKKSTNLNITMNNKYIIYNESLYSIQCKEDYE